MKNFFICGGYSSGNPGDEAILKATIYRLEGIHPGSHYYILKEKKDFNVSFDMSISYEFCFFEPLVVIKVFKKNSHLLTGLYRRSFPISFYLFRYLFQIGARVEGLIKKADYVVFVGGGYLNSFYNLLEMNYLCRLAKRTGKPVYLLGQTIGPFTRTADIRIAKDICAGVAGISLRDEGSFKEIKEYFGKTKLGIDEAFYLKYFDKKVHDDPRSSFCIGLNLRFVEGLTDKIRRDIADALDLFSGSITVYRPEVLFIPMEISRCSDDRVEGYKIKNVSFKNLDYHMLESPISLEDRIAAIRKTRLFLGMRYHTLVFAIAHSIPCIGIYGDEYYSRKIYGLFKQFGIEEYTVSLSNIHLLPDLMRKTFEDEKEFKEKVSQRYSYLMQNQEQIYKDFFKIR
jgi:polysaccharide pyruvyl transferase WcaK-like protein